jgi:hypothetical protein
MKKLFLVLAIVLAVASSSFAGVSFLTANSIGQGKFGLLGMYATDHRGDIAAAEGAQDLDSTSLGLRACYGLTSNLDLIAAYSADTLVNIKNFAYGLNPKEDSANTSGIGLKYTLAPMMPVDMAVAIGYQASSISLKNDAPVGTTSLTNSEMDLSFIVSKMVGICMPYGSVTAKSLSMTLDKKFTTVDIGSIGGTGLAFNVGCAIGIAANQAVYVEYNTEAQAWNDGKKGSAVVVPANSVSVSGISFGYGYMF